MSRFELTRICCASLHNYIVATISIEFAFIVLRPHISFSIEILQCLISTTVTAKYGEN